MKLDNQQQNLINTLYKQASWVVKFVENTPEYIFGKKTRCNEPVLKRLYADEWPFVSNTFEHNFIQVNKYLESRIETNSVTKFKGRFLAIDPKKQSALGYSIAVFPEFFNEYDLPPHEFWVGYYQDEKIFDYNEEMRNKNQCLTYGDTLPYEEFLVVFIPDKIVQKINDMIEEWPEFGFDWLENTKTELSFILFK
jgi:hypothetical protein